jgi:outer membrane biosynthesis protein TonB
MPRPLKPALVFLLCVSVWAQSASAPAQPPQPVQILSNAGIPYVPLGTDTYALEPISLSSVSYPLLLRQQKIQGVVVELILVSETGDVEAVRIVKGDTVLGDFAELAAKR